MTFEVRCEVELKLVYRLIQSALQDYREENKGPTLCAVQSALPLPALQSLMPGESPSFHTAVFIIREAFI